MYALRRFWPVLLLVVACDARAAVEQVNPLLAQNPDGSMSKLSIVHTRLMGETLCDTMTRQSAGCCEHEDEHKFKCCQNKMVCQSGSPIDESCDPLRKASTCCSTPAAKCCTDACFTTPEIREKEDVEPEVTEKRHSRCTSGSDENACCQPGQHTCCRHCPLPFVFNEVDAHSSVVPTQATPAAPPAPAKPPTAGPPPPPAPAKPPTAGPPPPPSPAPLAASVPKAAGPPPTAPPKVTLPPPPQTQPRPAPPAKPSTGCAPAGCPQAKGMVKVKVDCAAETGPMPCCQGDHDHLWICCIKKEYCMPSTRIGDMKMGRLCTEDRRMSTCCTTAANSGCCRQCSTQPVFSCASPVTACCTAQVTSCCKTC